MPHLRFNWHGNLKEVEREYRSTRFAVQRLLDEVAANPSTLIDGEPVGASLRAAYDNLEGTYRVRLFAAFEAGLRSFDRAKHNDAARKEDAAILIDSISGEKRAGNLCLNSCECPGRTKGSKSLGTRSRLFCRQHDSQRCCGSSPELPVLAPRELEELRLRSF